MGKRSGKSWLLVSIGMALALLLALSATTASAQQSNGTLAVGQPSTGQITTAGETLRFDYTVAQTSEVTLQALSDSMPPKVAILQGDTVVASEENAAGALTINLNSLLAAGSYVVEVGGTTDATGLVILVVQSETPLSVTQLPTGQRVQGTVDGAAPLALYSFSAMGEPAYLYVDSDAPDAGVPVQVVNTTTGQVSGQSGADVIGARFKIAAGNGTYQVEVGGNGASSASQNFSLCLAAVSANGCEASAVTPLQPTAVPPEPTAQTVACNATSSAGGAVNIRQSATTASVIVGTLPSSASAQVIGISPGGSFYNILYGGVNGWVALSVVNGNGDCSSVPVVNPPAVISPTQPPAAPPPPSQPTQSGPCLIHVNSPTYIYTTTIAQIDYLFDQVQSGQLIPIGRLSDNSWWQTNNYGAWIPSSAFGDTASISGDCSGVPVVAAP